MSPEYNFHLKIVRNNLQEARNVKSLFELVAGVTITMLNQGASLGDNFDLNTPIGEVIQSWRNNRGLNATQLAERVADCLGRRVSTVKAYISKIEKNQINNLGANYRMCLAAALEIPEVFLATHQLPPVSENNSFITSPPASDLLSQKEAADYLKVHPKTLYRYTRSGKLQQYKPGGIGRPRYLRSDLDALMQ